MGTGAPLRILGIDIGATNSRGRVTVGLAVIAEAAVGSASVTAQGLDAALTSLDDLLGRLGVEGSPPFDAVCLGAAGMREDAERLFINRLVGLTNDGLVIVVEDGELVLPAAGIQDGVGLIAGTGSVALGRYGERRAKAGGWGYLLADEGSGYWLVRRAVRALLERRDRSRPLGDLGSAVLAAAGVGSVEELADQAYDDRRPGTWAALAPNILGSQDPIVPTLIREAAAALDALVDATLEALGRPDRLPIVLSGGLSHHPRFREEVISYLRETRPSGAVSVLQVPPVAGAVRLAQEAARARVVGA